MASNKNCRNLEGIGKERQLDVHELRVSCLVSQMKKNYKQVKK